MSSLVFLILIFVISVAGGLFGSLLGLGGGLIVVPGLTLLLGLDIRFAIGASIICIIATSSGSGAAYVRDHLTNLRVAMFLELGTTAGAVAGALLAGILAPGLLYLLFAAFLALSCVAMFRRREDLSSVDVPQDPWADRLRLHSTNPPSGVCPVAPYRVTRSLPALGVMGVAGLFSGLLGIGSGALKVPAMDLLMRLPIKVSSATSNFMIGVTAAASAGVYFARGDIDPVIAGPVALGVLAGAFVGSRLLVRISTSLLRKVFVLVLALVALQMFVKGVLSWNG